MTLLPSSRSPILAIGFCSLVFASLAAAHGHAPDPARLPLCHMGSDADACRLPVKNGGFDNLDGWAREGLPSIGYDASGNPYAALHAGAAVGQAVYAHFGTLPQHAAYVLRFKVRADRGAAQVRASIALGEQSGEHTLPLGETTTTARAGEWRTVELMVNGAAFAAPAHIMLRIAHEGGDYLQLDDVHLIQADSADVLSR